MTIIEDQIKLLDDYCRGQIKLLETYDVQESEGNDGQELIHQFESYDGQESEGNDR